MKAIIRKHFISLLVAIAVFVASSVGMVKFVAVLFARQGRVIEAKERLASYEANKKIFADETKKFKTITERTEALEVFRITPASVPTLLTNLETLGSKNHVTFSITSVQTPNAGGETAKLFVDFSAKGTEGNIENFLEDLAHQPYEVRFKRFSLNKSADSYAPITQPTTTETGTPVQETVVSSTPTWELVASLEVISF